jgi:hypothetical protein
VTVVSIDLSSVESFWAGFEEGERVEKMNDVSEWLARRPVDFWVSEVTIEAIVFE